MPLADDTLQVLTPRSLLACVAEHIAKFGERFAGHIGEVTLAELHAALQASSEADANIAVSWNLLNELWLAVNEIAVALAQNFGVTRQVREMAHELEALEYLAQHALVIGADSARA